MRRLVIIAGGALFMSGCFTSTTDFRDDAQGFIVESEQIRNELGVTFTSAECAEPTNREVGTEFACTATDENGSTWTFTAEIIDDDEYVLDVDRRP